MSSLENRVTLNTYLREATMCLALQLISDGKEEYTPPHLFVKRCFEPLGENARVLEIGAADGAFANGMRLGGLNIVVSEAVSSMRKYSSIPESEWILFNIIDDDFPDIFDGILAWRVFIHFSSKDLLDAPLSLWPVIHPLLSAGWLRLPAHGPSKALLGRSGRQPEVLRRPDLRLGHSLLCGGAELQHRLLRDCTLRS